MHRPKLIGETFRMFDRFGSRDPSAPFSSLLAYFQPLPAILGLIFCFLTVFFFSTASWWNGMESSTNVVASMITVSNNQCSGESISDDNTARCPHLCLVVSKMEEQPFEMG